MYQLASWCDADRSDLKRGTRIDPFITLVWRATGASRTKKKSIHHSPMPINSTPTQLDVGCSMSAGASGIQRRGLAPVISLKSHFDRNQRISNLQAAIHIYSPQALTYFFPIPVAAYLQCHRTRIALRRKNSVGTTLWEREIICGFKTFRWLRILLQIR